MVRCDICHCTWHHVRHALILVRKIKQSRHILGDDIDDDEHIQTSFGCKGTHAISFLLDAGSCLLLDVADG